jgi:hypothetical protein
VNKALTLEESVKQLPVPWFSSHHVYHVLNSCLPKKTEPATEDELKQMTCLSGVHSLCCNFREKSCR